MSKKKNKVCTAEGAQKVLNAIEQFNNTDKGDPNRVHFAAVIVALQDSRLFTHDELQRRLPKDTLRTAYSVSCGTSVDRGTRTRLIRDATERAEEIISKENPAMTQAEPGLNDPPALQGA